MKSAARPRSVDVQEPWLRALAPAGTALIVLILGLVAYISTRREGESRRLVEHSHDVQLANQSMLARMVDAETGERGFIITGDDRFLEPYRGAVDDARRSLASLRQLTVDNPAQQVRVARLDTLITRRLTTFETRIAARRTNGFAGAQEAAVMGSGKAVMDSIRAVSADIHAEEEGLLSVRQQHSADRARTVEVVVVAGTLAAIVLAFLLNLMLARYAERQERLAVRLDEQNRVLEEQAAELETSNQQLQEQATEIEAARDALITRTQEAEEANRAKADFLARMSHELRTPLNAISGYVDLLELGIRGPVSDAQGVDLRRIKRSSNHLLGLINDILNFAKLESGRPHLVLEDLHVQAVLAEIESFIAPQLAAKGLTFTMVSCPTGTQVWADREKLNQILINLLTNAYKFTPAGGRVTLRCESLPGRVRIHVEDSGRGIPADKLGAIFEPFVQVAPRADGEGVGLGLAITRELVRALDGDLTVTSVVNAGSTFTVTLPDGASAARAMTRGHAEREIV